ncbi:MAG: O-antigen ligase family protein [Blastocatellales bacterium]
MMNYSQTATTYKPAQPLILDRLVGGLMTYRDLAAVLFLALHIPLGLIINRVPVLAVAHAGAVFLLGVWWAFFQPKIERVALVGGYIVGSEVLWRMMRTGVFWEFGKYAIIFLFALALIRTRRLRGPVTAFLFFFFLLPSVVLPMASVDSVTLLGDLRFYLSGPLALSVSVWFFSHARLGDRDRQMLYYAILGPILSISFITLSGIMSAEKLNFSNNSNYATSGGFGPNQVSATLGLGILIAFLATTDRTIRPIMRMLAFAIMIFAATQCALTFSRSGIYMAAGAIAVATFYLMRNRKHLFQLVCGLCLLGVIVNFVLLPRLDEFTDGALSKRFLNTRLTNRDRIAEADLMAFWENPVFGVGPGQARYYRRDIYESIAAHTEFSRLLAEHGLFGLSALILLGFMTVQHLTRARTARDKASVASLITWSFLFMLVSAMRLAAPAFAFGLTAASSAPAEDEPAVNQR